MSLLECSTSQKLAPTECEGPIRSKRPLSVSEAVQLWNAPRLRDVRSALELDVNGYVAATNRAEVPECALQLPRKTTLDCKEPVPTVWIADSPSASPSAALLVRDFAPSYSMMFAAHLYNAMANGDDVYRDARTGAFVADEFPSAGTRVKLRARLIQSAEVPLPDAPPLDPLVARAQVADESFEYTEERPRFEPWPEAPAGVDAELVWPLESWAHASLRANPSCAEASITVGKPWQAHFFSRDEQSRVYPVTCTTSTPIFGTAPDENGEPVEHQIGSNVSTTSFLAFVREGRRYVDFACQEGTGYESSYSCASAWFVLPGAGKDLDLMVRFGSGCSDAGCDAELAVTGFFEGAPELPPFPEKRDIVGGQVELKGREVHIDGDMDCTRLEAARSTSEQCTVERRYVLRYENGKLRLTPR